MSDVAPVTLSISRGGAKTYAGTHQTSGSDTTPVNITGWTIKVTIRDDKGRAVISKTAGITVGASGTYGFSVTHADTLLLPQPYRLDIQRTDSGSETLMGLGTLTITPEVLY